MKVMNRMPGRLSKNSRMALSPGDGPCRLVTALMVIRRAGGRI
jgi:hypothetical protein